MSDQIPSSSIGTHKLYLLRHSIVASHRGDVPITDEGIAVATEVGRRLVAKEGRFRLICGETLRARQTAQAIASGARAAGATVTDPHVAFALRNPDLYLAGERVNMVSSIEALTAQVDGLTPEQACSVPFFRDFLAARDRIGFWLQYPNPPGDDRAAVARRITKFAASLGGHFSEGVTVAVTHSPVLRACALEIVGNDPGEPKWVAGLSAQVRPDRSVHFAMLPEAP